MFVFTQTVQHRDFFLPVERGERRLPDDDHDGHADPPSDRAALISLALLVVALVAVVGLAKVESPSIEDAVAAVGFPHAFVGVVIALLVLLPESISAVRAARRGRVQTSLNLAYGSAMASIGLTIPTIAVASIWLDGPLALGLGETQIVLLLTVGDRGRAHGGAGPREAADGRPAPGDPGGVHLPHASRRSSTRAAIRTAIAFDPRDCSCERVAMFCSRPTASMPANSDEPPYDTNGRGTPVTGMMPRHMPMFWKVWKPNQQAIPAAATRPKVVGRRRGDRQRPPDHDAQQGDDQRRRRAGRAPRPRP